MLIGNVFGVKFKSLASNIEKLNNLNNTPKPEAKLNQEKPITVDTTTQSANSSRE